MAIATHSTAPADYRPGQYVGTSRGQVVFDRVGPEGRPGVRTRSTVYALPDGVRGREGIRHWVQTQLRTGGIGTRLYPRPGEYDPSRVLAMQQAVGEALSGPVVRRQALERLTALLKPLGGAERQALVNLLATTRSSRGSQLDHWLSEALTSGLGELGPLSAAQRGTLFAALVEGQDPANLERIAKATGRARTGLLGTGDRDTRYMEEFARTVSARGTWEQRLGLLKRLSDDAVGGRPGAARAMGELFASCRTRREVEAAFAELDRPSTDAMVAAALRLRAQVTTSLLGGNGSLIHGDTTLYRRMAAAASLSTNATEKASFVAASGAVLEASQQINLDSIAHRRTLLGALSGVIGTDVFGIVDNTLMQSARTGCSSGRRALQTYVSGVLDTGHGSHLQAIVLSLQRGPDGGTDPMIWLAATQARNGEAPQHHRARVMGEFLGLVASAVDSRQRGRDVAAALGYALFAGTTDAFKESVSTVFPAIKLPAGLGAAAAKATIAGALLEWRVLLRNDEADLVRALHDLALPRHRSGAEATAPWVTTFDAHYFGSMRR